VFLHLVILIDLCIIFTENSLDETDGLGVGELNNIPSASPRTMGCSRPVTLGEEASEEDREVIVEWGTRDSCWPS
jgi:hypothetical protein